MAAVEPCTEQETDCQLLGIVRSFPRAGLREERGIPLLLRIKRALKRRLSVRTQRKIKALLRPELGFRFFPWPRRKMQVPGPVPAQPPRLNAGERVRVRSKEQIEATLDRWRSLKGCGFLDEMVRYCGSTQRVLKRVERFIDERDYRLKRSNGIVLLEGVMCSGTGTTGQCDRSCLFFWREEWLERLDENHACLGRDPALSA